MCPVQVHLGNGMVEVPVTITPLGQGDSEDTAEGEGVEAVVEGAQDAASASDQTHHQYQQQQPHPHKVAENSVTQQQPSGVLGPAPPPPRSAPSGALSYLVSYTAPAVPGLYRLQVVDGATGRHVRGSPFSLRVRPGPPPGTKGICHEHV